MSHASTATRSLIRDTAAGYQDTRLILSTKWHSLRSTGTRLAILLAAGVALAAVLLSANLGYAIKFVAVNRPDTTAGIFANTWILSLQRNELGNIGAITIAAAVLAAIIAPFTGSSTLSFIPPEDTHTLRLSRLHRYFESWLINAISGIGILQLLALTAVASVLTIEGSRAGVMFVSWSVWLLLITVTTTIGWSLEWVTRRWGAPQRRFLAALGMLTAGAVVLWDLNTPSSLMSVGDTYARWATTLSTTPNLAANLLPVLAVLTLVILTASLGLAATWKAFCLPAPLNTTSRSRKPEPLPSTALNATIRLLTRTLWRTPESRRPILAILVIGAPAMALFTMNENVESALMLAIPTAISLAWGVNIFGLFGTGIPWLASQPRILTALPRVASALQLLLTVLLIVALWLVSYFAGNADPGTGQRIVLGGVVAAALTTSLSSYLSITRPVRARLSGRGDSLTPPLTTLTYLGVLVAFACLPAILIVGTVPSAWQAPAAAIGVLAALAIWVTADQLWKDPSRRAAVAAAVAA